MIPRSAQIVFAVISQCGGNARINNPKEILN